MEYATTRTAVRSVAIPMEPHFMLLSGNASRHFIMVLPCGLDELVKEILSCFLG